MPRGKDENETAFSGFQELMRRDAQRDGIELEGLPAPEKMACRVEAGRKGGLVGGKARANKLTSEQRREIAIIAAQSR